MTSDPSFQMPKTPWPLRPFDWAFSAIAARNIAASESSVNDPQLWLKTHRWMAIRLLVVMVAAGVIVASTQIPWWGLIGWLVIIMSATTGAMSIVMQGRNYQSGWLHGRRAMLASLQEADSRGMGLGEWITGELERDLMVMSQGHRPE